jgi:hypothetical protein
LERTVLRRMMMSLNTAAFIAFVAMLLVAALSIWNLVMDVLGVLRGLMPVIRLLPASISAFASVAVTLFLFVFQKQRGA